MSLVKLYEIWPSKNNFYCGGRCIAGPDRGAFYCTVSLIVVPSALWFAFVGPYVWNNFSPAVVVIGGYILLLQLLCLVTAGFMDPGIIPRSDRNKALISAYIERVTDPYYQQLPDKKEVAVGQHSQEIKFCKTCNIFRPPRASHCSTCDNCVDKFDHHCPWVGNCIGRRNYKFFLGFLFLTWIMCFYMFSVSLSVQIEVSKGSDASGMDAVIRSISVSPVSMIMILYSFVVFFSVAGLGGYHFYLTSKERSTNEDLKGGFTDKTNPYNRGFIRNWVSTLCSPIRASFIDGTQVVSISSTDVDDKRKLLSSPKAK